jgi:hypothetical protein
MSKTVWMTSGTPVSEEIREELRQLAAMPDSTIDTKDIPEWTPEQWAAAKARRRERLQAAAPELQKRAS